MVLVFGLLFVGSLLVNFFLSAVKYYDIKRDEKQRARIEELNEENSVLKDELETAFERIQDLETLVKN